MKSTVTFKQFFYENITSGAINTAGGGFSPNNISGSDFYAPGDARIPKGGAVYTRAGKLRARKKRKNKKRKK